MALVDIHYGLGILHEAFDELHYGLGNLQEALGELHWELSDLHGQGRHGYDDAHSNGRGQLGCVLGWHGGGLHGYYDAH